MKGKTKKRKKWRRVALLLLIFLLGQEAFLARAFEVTIETEGAQNLDTGDFEGDSVAEAEVMDEETGHLNEESSSILLDVLDTIERRYGFDPNLLRRTKRKSDAPTVEIIIDKTSPRIGEKVTARAIAKTFRNSPQNLYYTWFLIKTDDQGRVVDADGDGKTDDEIDNGKRRAMQIVARGAYDPDLFGADYSDAGNDQDGDGGVAPVGGIDGVGAKYKYNREAIGEWEKMHFTGTDDSSRKELVDREKITRCYRHNFGVQDGGSSLDQVFAGEDLIVKCEHKFATMESGMPGVVLPDGFSGSGCGGSLADVEEDDGDGRFTTAEEQCWGLDPNNPDTDGDGVEDELDLAGLNQQQLTWNFEKGDRVGVVVEGTSSIPINEGEQGDEANPYPWGQGATTTHNTLNSYYKIMWAGMGFCNEDEEYMGFVDGDECDEEAAEGEEYLEAPGDTGFTYLKTIPVNQAAYSLPKVELSYWPENPQISTEDELDSDRIVVSASVTNEGADDDFLYYEWHLERCEKDSAINCSEIGLNNDNSTEVKMFSANQGVGVKELVFQPLGDLVGKEAGIMVKITVIVSRDRTDDLRVATDVVIPLLQNNLGIKFYPARLIGGKWRADKNNEICKDNLYQKICPVFNYQVIAAEIDVLNGVNNVPVTYSWSYGGEKIPPPQSCVFAEAGEACMGGNNQMVYFPVYGSPKALYSISVKAERGSGEDLAEDDFVAERIISTNNPLPIIKPASANVVATKQANGEDSEMIFEANSGEKVAFEAELVPEYLKVIDRPANADKSTPEPLEVYLDWYLGGKKVTEEFIENNEELEIVVSGNRLEFVLEGNYGSNFEVAARVEKPLSQDSKQLLFDAWEATETNTIVNKKGVTLKVAYQSSATVTYNGSLKGFFASVAKNAPHYLIFNIRLALALVLVWSLIFGFGYSVGFVGRENKR